MTKLPASPPQPGLRRTRQRAAISDLLGRIDDFRTAQQIHDILRDEGVSVGLTTVYRTLQAMADAGEVDAIRHDGETAFRRCHTADHHHHLVCRRCGHAVEIFAPVIEQWAEAIAREHGFRDADHELEIFGLCADCPT
ncbi:MAG TPA: transcriptional repressor [Propionibacterium sp.]|jgi:Fur family ferric uptake transcriptional regulator|nr:transcriptional repressor [Propionibacterium sp.]